MEEQVPTLLEPDAVTGHYHFPAQMDLDLTSPTNVAARRRGRFVIKLAAALYLAELPEFDTPAKCASAMSYLWGHTRLGLAYLRRSRHRAPWPSPADVATPSAQQLNVAESRWKAQLGEQVVERNGFQQCWDELVPFFQQSVAELAKSEAEAAKAPPCDDASAVAPARRAPLPSQPPPTAALECGAPAASTASPTLDLAKVPARALSILYEKTVRHLRLVTAARGAAAPDSTPAQQHLASRGWLPLRQIIPEVRADLETEPTLKALWAWMAALAEARQHAFFLAVLQPMNAVGKLQLLHDAGGAVTADNASRLPPETARTAPTTHLRAAWGHKDADVAAAVLREHVLVALRSLAPLEETGGSEWSSATGAAAPRTPPSHGAGSRRQSDQSGTPPRTAESEWFEFIEDTRMLRREATETHGRLYPQHRPLQVLVPRSFIEALSMPLQPARPEDRDTPAGAPLAALVQRTTALAADASRVTYGEVMALLQPRTTFCVTAFFAATTGGASRFAFIPVAPTYFSAQTADVQGWYMPQHLLRVQHEGHDVTAVPAPGSAVALLVYPCTLTSGVLHRSAAVPVPARPSPRPALPTPPPSAATVLDCGVLYDLHQAAGATNICVTARRPETQRVVSLRIASLWELWCTYGVRRESDEADSVSGLRLMWEDDIGLAVRLNTGSASSAAAPRTEGGVDESDSSVTAVALNPMIHHLPWEFFPATEMETTLRRLDAAYRAELHRVCERCRSTCLQLLRPEASGAPSRDHVTVNGSLESHEDPMATAAHPRPSAAHGYGTSLLHPLTLREVEDREQAMWNGLSEWMRVLERVCALPLLSLLLPPDVCLAAATEADVGDGRVHFPGGFIVSASPSSSSASPPAAAADPQVAARAKRLCAVGRKKALATLRRLIGGADTPLLFYVDAEVNFDAPLNPATHRLWLMEPEPDDTEAWAVPAAAACDVPAASAMSSASQAPASAANSGALVSRGKECWTVAARRELVAATVNDAEGEPTVSFYVRLPCVLHRPRARHTDAVVTAADADYTALRQRGVRDTSVAPLRLCRYARRRPPADAAPAQELEWQLEELSTHAPRRYAHHGCRVTPLACDEVVLGAAWPVEAIVEYALLPPLREALELFAQRRRAEVLASRELSQLRQLNIYAVQVPSAAALQAIADDLRRELLLVLTDEAAMELREFYGDALVDYCASVTTLSYRSAASNAALWRGGNITESSTNASLVVGMVPGVLRKYWLSRRRICKGKRLADSVESLFGAVAMALWVHPRQRRRRTATATAAAADANAPPDADLLVYVASALLELLGGGR